MLTTEFSSDLRLVKLFYLGHRQASVPGRRARHKTEELELNRRTVVSSGRALFREAKCPKTDSNIGQNQVEKQLLVPDYSIMPHIEDHTILL